VTEGDGGGERSFAFTRKKMNSDGFARFGNLNKRYGLGSVNTRGIKYYRPRSFATEAKSFIIGLGPLPPEAKSSAVNGNFVILGATNGL